MRDFTNYHSGLKLSPITALQRPSYVLLGAAKDFEESYVNPLINKSPTYDQGNTSMCVGCAIALSRWFMEYSQSNNREPYSPAMVYANRKDSDWQGEGMYYIEALDNLVDYGICYEKDFSMWGSYEDVRNKYLENKEYYEAEGHKWRISSWYRCITTRDIKQAIKEVGFVIGSIPIYYCFYFPVGKTIVFEPSMIYDYHAILILGWNKDGWIIKNSWGSDYGENGVVILPYTYPVEEAFTCVDDVTEAKYMKINNFTDAYDAAWAKNSLEKAVDAGVFNGYEEADGTLTLKPNNFITRAEIAAVLDRSGILDELIAKQKK